MRIVCKFGGTSMATPTSIRQVASILKANPYRKVGVVSAPGRINFAEKVTDLLIQRRLDEVMERLQQICVGLSLTRCFVQVLERELYKRTHEDEILAFGEYASARILALVTGKLFVDATDIISFRGNEVVVNEDPLNHMCGVIVPGFYGLDTETKQIRTFSRGGSDISGAHIAAELNADLYENWTDVSGVYSQDPNLHKTAMRYEYLRYHELATIVSEGATVFHPQAIFPVLKKHIPVMIRNTFFPHEIGTLIF